MAKKLINTSVKLGKGTVLFEAFSEKYTKVSLGAGDTYNILNWDKKGGIILYYSLIGNAYLNQFIIPSGVETWFYDNNAGTTSALYVRMYNNQIQVSSASTGYAKIIGFILLN